MANESRSREWFECWSVTAPIGLILLVVAVAFAIGGVRGCEHQHAEKMQELRLGVIRSGGYSGGVTTVPVPTAGGGVIVP